LRSLYTSQLSDSSLVGLFSGFLNCFANSDNQKPDFSSAKDLISLITTQDQTALSALRKMVLLLYKDKFVIIVTYCMKMLTLAIPLGCK